MSFTRSLFGCIYRLSSVAIVPAGFHLGDGSCHPLELLRHPLPSLQLLEKGRRFAFVHALAVHDEVMT